MDKEKLLTLKSLAGETIVFTLKTMVSEWDLEQVSSIYAPYMVYNAEKELYEFDKSRGSEAYAQRSNKLLELFVLKWNGSTDGLNPDNIKKNLSREEFAKLSTEIDKIYNSQTLSEEKKSLTPNSSSEPSATNTAPSSPENS